MHTITDLNTVTAQYRAYKMYLEHLEKQLQSLHDNPSMMDEKESISIIEREYFIAHQLTEQSFFQLKNLQT